MKHTKKLILLAGFCLLALIPLAQVIAQSESLFTYFPLVSKGDVIILTPSTTLDIATNTPTISLTPSHTPTNTPIISLTPSHTPTRTPTITTTPDGSSRPDLEITYMIIQLETGNSCSYPSTTLGRRVYFRNNGPAAVSAPFVVQADSDQLIYSDGLAAGASASLWFVGGATMGQHTAQIDATFVIDESDETNNVYEAYIPIPTLPPTCTPTSTPITPTPDPIGAILIDHRHTNINAIPTAWLLEARQFMIHYAHTSHGSQILSGLTYLGGQNTQLSTCTLWAPPDHDPGELPTACPDPNQLRIYDGQPGYADQPYVDYITPDLYWEMSDGITRTHIAVSSGVFDISLWTWCGQASYYSTEQITQYLDFMAGLENDFPGLRTVLYTGHTDGGSAELAANNALIRQYAIDNGLALFDFADIERYAPNGSGPYENDGEGNCEWCDQWCTDHPGDCQTLPDDCAHSHPLVCKLKGQAFWWLLARMAGWDGVSP